MKKEGFSTAKRSFKSDEWNADLVIIGGGIAGTCCAITAARQGLQVVLVQDRPVLGGNGSSEIRLWILGATSHMGNNNRWSREGGVMDEILLENLYRNPEGNPLILDTILLEMVSKESNIRLLLNTVMHDMEKNAPDKIERVTAFCSQNATQYLLRAPLFVDASGDGALAFLAGAAFRMGAEAAEEFDEAFAPDHNYGELLGHSLYFYSKDTGKPVRFVPPAYANRDLSRLPRFKSFNLREQGCRLWWVEYGGRKDTIHDSESIKWELWRVIYGIWDYLKNSGKFPETATHTLEWVGTIPGKRESRRFEGDFMLSQKDLVHQKEFDDAVSFGGWALDLHPADGVYGDQPGCTQWHTKGVYQIPYRIMYSKNIKNLFLAGRIVSSSHVAFGSTRVMATCGHNAQAVAMAAYLCRENGLLPADLLESRYMKQLQNRLIRWGQYIPGLALADETDLTQKATITTSSTYSLIGLPMDGPWKSLEFSMAQLLPLQEGEVPRIRFKILASEATRLQVTLMRSKRKGNFTPELILAETEFNLTLGEQYISVDFQYNIEISEYYFVAFSANEKVQVKASETRLTGVLTVFQKFNKSVATSSRQEPPPSIGMEAFDFWLPERRPAGHNLGFELDRPLSIFKDTYLVNGIFRPTYQSNAWTADQNDDEPTIELKWDKIQLINEIKLFFDTDYDHALESTLMGHPESVIPFCVRKFSIFDGNGKLLTEVQENYQSSFTLKLDQPLKTNSLKFILEHPSATTPAALFGILCY
ncbi:FAD-dependent oxidoreductase [Cyclobacterium jeungdonense]|uniref:FAD-dependent oxidoreductase n=1 Tax=Cyclobacterium jeungdonense TaxID=708087 RepID=A0ABT8C1Z4_9BACT|nr:FAD-dependent oxidoreductase [Cyclobacterium jeungdonense]MDN3686357.1 FAD-dependent oxidoreductase [Cyclobacterium jeungdonense]